MIQNLKVAVAIFLLVTFFHKSVFAEEGISPDDFTFINQYKNEEIVKSRLGVLSKTIGLCISEAANMGMIYYGCVALNSLAAHSPFGSASPEINKNSQVGLGKKKLCLALVSIVAPNEAAMVSNSSPWPNVYPWLETAQVLGAVASTYYLYRESIHDKPVAMLNGAMQFLAMSSLSSTFAALGTAYTGVRKSDFKSEDARRRYVYIYKMFDLALACAAAGTVANFALSNSGHPDSKAASLSIMLAGLAGMLGSFPVSDVLGKVKWAEPIKIPSLEHFISNTGEAIEEMIDSFQLPISYETGGNYNLGAGTGALLGISAGTIATAIYLKAGLMAIAGYAALANASGAIAGAYVSGNSSLVPLLGGLVGILIVPIIQEHTSLEESSARGLIAQTAVSFGVVVFINSLVNYYTQCQSIENTLTETNKWLWRKLYSPGKYLKHTLNLD